MELNYDALIGMIKEQAYKNALLEAAGGKNDLLIFSEVLHKRGMKYEEIMDALTECALKLSTGQEANDENQKSTEMP